MFYIFYLYVYIYYSLGLKVALGTVMQIAQALINNRSRVSKVSWKYHISTIYNFAVIYPWNSLFIWKSAYFLTVSVVFSAYKENFTAQ